MEFASFINIFAKFELLNKYYSIYLTIKIGKHLLFK